MIENYITTGGAVLVALVSAGFGYLAVRLEVQSRTTKKAAANAAERAVAATTTAVNANAEDHEATNFLIRNLARDVGGMRGDFRTLHSRIDALRHDLARIDDRIDKHLDEGKHP